MTAHRPVAWRACHDADAGIAVVALAVADCPDALVPSTTGRCADCRRPVWLAKGDALMWLLLSMGSPAYCTRCAAARGMDADRLPTADEPRPGVPPRLPGSRRLN